MEAAAMAKPVIGSRTVGLTEAVIDGETGILVTNGDVNGLSEAIRLITADNGLRKDLGENAKRRARRFTWDRLAKAREDFFLRVIEDYRHRGVPPSRSGL
jgi:D-inositol-3-phosphate glycosyltransferase